MVKRPPRFVILVAGVVALVIIALGYSGGCASTTLPPKLTAAQRDAVRNTRLTTTVAVERYRFPAYSDGLVVALRDTGLFQSVDHSERLKSPADLLARIERPIHGTATIPVLTGISLGLIPTTVQEEHGYSFSFSGPGPSAAKVLVELSYSGPSTLGWWSVVLNISPNRTAGDVKSHSRFREALAWAIASKRDEIQTLLRKSGA